MEVLPRKKSENRLKPAFPIKNQQKVFNIFFRE